MIYDQLDNFSRYAGIAPSVWSKIEKFLASAATLADGKYVIEGDDVFAGISTYKLKEFNADRLEYHLDYADIQLLLKGEEDFIFAPIDGLEEVRAYQPDVGLRRLIGPGTPLRLKIGNFALAFPGEGHLPGVGSPDTGVTKVVIKIAKRRFV